MTSQSKSVPQIREILSNSDEHTDVDQEMQENKHVNNNESTKHHRGKDRVTIPNHRNEAINSDSGDVVASDSYDNEESSDSHGRDLQPIPRGRRDKARPRRSFEQDMYQERDETSDERKKKILRQGRATKRHEQDDHDESSDEDIYDNEHNDGDRRYIKRDNDLYRSRGQGRRRSPGADPKGTGSYRKSNGNNGDGYRYAKRGGYSDARRGYRNKR